MYSRKAVKYYEQGRIFQQQGRLSEARRAYKKALKINHNFVEALNNLANVLLDSGKFKEAADYYVSALKYQPTHPMLLNNLGNALQLQGKNEQALALVKKAINYDHDYADAYSNLGNALRGLGRLDDAVKAYNDAIRINPGLDHTYNNLGSVLKEQNKLDDAVASFTKAIEINPGHQEAYNGLGNALRGQGKIEEAMAAYMRAIEINPRHQDAYNGLGNVLLEKGRIQEAMALYKQAIEIDPEYQEAYNGLGNALMEQARLEEAKASYRQAIMIDPGNQPAYDGLGNALTMQGRFEEAVASYRQAIEIKPEPGTISNLLLSLNYNSQLTQAEIYSEHVKLAREIESRIPLSSLNQSTRSSENKRLRIGYISPDFRLHSVAYFFEPLLEAHDKNAIEVYCYYNDAKIDDKTKRLMHEAEHWRSIVGMNDENVIELVKNDKIDILVDLAGHTGKNRLGVFAHKPAPVQVTWLGYPNTTGLSAIDYRLTDSIADPVGASDKLHSEELVRLPSGFLCFRGDNSAEISTTLPCRERGYITFGSFNNLSKITTEVVRLWSRVLGAIPESHLLIKSKQLACDETKSRFLNKFSQEGITSDRIELYASLPRTEDHLKLYNCIDIGLDPFPYNGATTTCEALWMGVPVITLFGERHSGRVGASIMTHAKLEEFIANDPDEYVELAIKYASNTDYLEELRVELRDKMQRSFLCNAKVFARNVEESYRKMWDQYNNGNPGNPIMESER